MLLNWEQRNFRKVDGGHIFFPYGALARGYIVDDAKKAELIAFFKRLNRLWPLMLIAAAAGWWIADFDGLMLGCCWYLCPSWATMISQYAGRLPMYPARMSDGRSRSNCAPRQT